VSLYKPPNSANWYYSISHQGQRYRNTTGTADKKQAQELHDKIKHDLWREKLGERYITFGDACATWLKAASRGESDRYRTRCLIKNIGSGTNLREVDSGLIDRALSEKGQSTKRRYINLVSAICRLSGHNPNLKRPAVKEGRIRWLTKQEWKALRGALQQVAPHLSPIAAIGITTGMRMSNILNLEWSQCDLQRGLVWIHPDQSKSGKPISVPLSSDALKVLRQQQKVKHEKYVFPYYTDGTPITRVSNHGWKAACKAAGLEDITFHTLRHTFASWHIQNGTPIEILQKLGGWSDLKMVMRYAHLGESYVANYANNAKPRS